MKHSLTIGLCCAAVSIAAGTVIAGLPASPPGRGLRIDAPAPVRTTTTTTNPPTAAPASSSTTTTIAPAPTTEASVTVAVSTTAPTTAPPIPRAPADISVATVNATDGVGGIAGSTAEVLAEFGYDALPVDAVTAAEVSAVYYDVDFEADAAELAEVLGWGRNAILPLTAAPDLDTERTFELVAVIGTDLA